MSPFSEPRSQSGGEAPSLAAAHKRIALLEDRLVESNQRFEEKIEEFSTLRTMGDALNSTLDLPRILDRVLALMVDKIGAENCSIMLLDERTLELEVSAARGTSYSPGLQQRRRFKMGQGIAGWVAQNGKPALVRNVDEESRFEKIEAASGKIGSMLCLPLTANNQVVGVLNLSHPTLEAFTENNQRVLTILAGQVAVAIMNARLYQELKQVCRDLETKNAQMEDANRDLLRLNTIKSEFVSSVSHELRTPLTLIKGFTATLLKHPDLGADRQRHFLEITNRESDRLTRLIGGLLDLSKIEEGRFELSRSHFDVRLALEETGDFFRPMTVQKGLDFSLALNGLENLSLYADRDRFTQGIYNLLSNALKFTPHGGEVRLETSIGAFRSARELVVAVSDTGIGIPESDLPFIYEKFFRGGQSGKMTPGTGIGLSIVKAIGDSHGWTVSVSSAENQGTRFKISIPLEGAP